VGFGNSRNGVGGAVGAAIGIFLVANIIGFPEAQFIEGPLAGAEMLNIINVVGGGNGFLLGAPLGGTLGFVLTSPTLPQGSGGGTGGDGGGGS